MDENMRSRPQDMQRWLDAYDWATDDDMPLHPLQEAWKNVTLDALEEVEENETDSVIINIYMFTESLREFLVKYARRYAKFDDFEECDAALFWRCVALKTHLNIDTFDLLYNRDVLREITEN